MVARHRGKPTLMIRIASDRLGVLYDAAARLSALIPEETEEGQVFRNIVDLPLMRATIPVFALSWTLMHVLDETSPIGGMDAAAMQAAGLRFFLMVRAEDATLGTTVRDLRAYTPAEIRFGMRYADALSTTEHGLPVLDLDRLGLIEPDPSAGGQ